MGESGVCLCVRVRQRFVEGFFDFLIRRGFMGLCFGYSGVLGNRLGVRFLFCRDRMAGYERVSVFSKGWGLSVR